MKLEIPKAITNAKAKIGQSLKGLRDKINKKTGSAEKSSSKEENDPPPEASKLVSSASLIKQIQCPTLAPTKVSTLESIPFVFGTAIPETLGYISGYNFTGLGSNDPDDGGLSGFGQKAGLSGGYSKSKIVLGFNYFYPIHPFFF